MNVAVCSSNVKTICSIGICRPEKVPRLFDLVTVKDSSILPAFYFALRDTLVAKDLDQATRIGLQGSTRYRVVTLQGELVDVSGTMSGGGGRVSRGRMGKAVLEDSVNAEDLDTLARQVGNLEMQVGQLQERRGILEDKITALRKDLTASRHALQKFQVEVKVGSPSTCGVALRNRFISIMVVPGFV